ncbi:MAG: hypothetical protein ABSC05_40790 [Candidatus Solibacter sp.]|jgi:hypothetical protein
MRYRGGWRVSDFSRINQGFGRVGTTGLAEKLLGELPQDLQRNGWPVLAL